MHVNVCWISRLFVVNVDVSLETEQQLVVLVRDVRRETEAALQQQIEQHALNIRP